MNVSYFSSTIIPSRKANSVHIMKMCSAFSSLGHNVRLYCHKGKDEEDVFLFYNVNEFDLVYIPTIKLKYFGYIVAIFMNIHNLIYGSDVIVSRHVVAAWISTLFGKKTILETHVPISDYGRLSRFLIKSMLKRSSLLKFIVITESLKRKVHGEVSSYIEVNKIQVLPDASDDYYKVFTDIEKKIPSSKCYKLGYIGSFYEGKGIKIVKELVKKLPDIEFHVVGGSTAQVNDLERELLDFDNFKMYGFLSHDKAMNIAYSMDALLLPNSSKVLVSNDKDIGNWTSPLKMFEYMALKKVIFATELDVLKEILTHDGNAILCKENDISDWVDKITKTLADKDKMNSISERAYDDFLNNYTWKIRCEKMLS